MGLAVLHPQDCLKDPFSRDNLTPPLMKYPRKPTPNRAKRPQANRRRLPSPPGSQTKSPPASPPLPSRASAVVPKASNKKNPQPVIGQVKILKRGERIAKMATDLSSEEPDLGISGPDPEKVPAQILVPDPILPPNSLYAGPVTLTSPPPSELPLPSFFTKKSVSVLKSGDATSDLIRILRLDIS